MDYRAQELNKKSAEEFAARAFDLGGPRPWSGRELLQALMTPASLTPERPPDRARVDLDLFGKTQADLRQLADSEGLVEYRLLDALEIAFRLGLTFRLRSPRLNQTFYGVPAPVRELLGLKAPEHRPAPALAAGSAVRAAPLPLLGELLTRLARAVQGLPAKDELFEFTAQAAAAAAEAGLLPFEALPDEFVKKARSISFETPPLAAALLTLAEAAQGRPQALAAEALARQAAAEGLISATELREVLGDGR